MTQIDMEFEAKKGLSESELLQFESRLALKFPADYRQFLLEFNGGSPVEASFEFKDSTNGSELLGFFGFGSRRDIFDKIKIYRNRLPKTFFPIACDSGGNLICISLSEEQYGKVYFWDHDREADESQGIAPETAENTILIADSFDEFLNGLHE